MRVAIIGARSVAQGTGPYLARFCADAGAEVVALLGTTQETAAEAAEDLRASCGQTPRAHHEPDAFFEAQPFDALVIASPYETHARYLERALAVGVHVLCEKPLVWGGDDPAGLAQDLVRRFEAAGLLLRVQTQWPFTLETYRGLYPRAVGVPARFDMRMGPSARGVAMLVDALSHPLSLLAALAPDPAARIERPRCLQRDGGWDVRFDYRAAGNGIEAHVVLTHSPEAPRPAAYALDGAWAHRRVRLDPYRFELEGGGRTIPMPDPTPLLVRSFLAEAASDGPRTVDPAAVPGMDHLARLVSAAEEGRSPRP